MESWSDLRISQSRSRICNDVFYAYIELSVGNYFAIVTGWLNQTLCWKKWPPFLKNGGHYVQSKNPNLDSSYFDNNSTDLKSNFISFRGLWAVTKPSFHLINGTLVEVERLLMILFFSISIWGYPSPSLTDRTKNPMDSFHGDTRFGAATRGAISHVITHKITKF